MVDSIWFLSPIYENCLFSSALNTKLSNKAKFGFQKVSRCPINNRVSSTKVFAIPGRIGGCRSFSRILG